MTVMYKELNVTDTQENKQLKLDTSQLGTQNCKQIESYVDICMKITYLFP
jgi:hypothetical protein